MARCAVLVFEGRLPYQGAVYLRTAVVALVLGVLAGMAFYRVRRMRHRRLRNWLALSLYFSPFLFATSGVLVDSPWHHLLFWAAMTLLTGLFFAGLGITFRLENASDEAEPV